MVKCFQITCSLTPDMANVIMLWLCRYSIINRTSLLCASLG